jgi:hypothetical protein
MRKNAVLAKIAQAGLSFFSSLVILLPVSPINMPFAARDSGVFLYVGWRILNGEIPYRDVWDHKGPIIYYLDALGLLLSPNNTWGVWCVEFIFLVAAVSLSFIILKKSFGPIAALAGLYFWLLTFFITFAGGNLTTEYTIAFQFLLLYLVYRNESNPKDWQLLTIGFVSGLIFLTRQNGVGLPVAYALYLFFQAIVNRGYRQLLFTYGKILAGVIGAILPVAAYFALNNALSQFWDAAFVYNYFYSAARDTADRLYALQFGYTWLSQTGIAQLTLAGWLLAIFWLIRKRSSNQVSRALLWTAFIGLPIELAFVSIGGRPRIPYFLSLLPVCAILSAFSFWMLWKLPGISRLPKHLPATLAIIFALAVLFIQLPLYINSARGYHHIVDPNGAAKYIQENSTPNDYVLVWGAEAAINFFSRRASPTRFAYQYPLYYKDYASASTLEEFFQDILDKKPKFVLVTTGGATLNRSFSGNRTDKTDKMANIIRSRYTKKVRLGEWVLLEYQEK